MFMKEKSERNTLDMASVGGLVLLEYAFSVGCESNSPVI